MTKDSLLRKTVLWIIAILLMFGSVAYQRATGPTHPRRGTLDLGRSTMDYRLLRSEWSIKTHPGAEIRIPDPGDQVSSAQLLWKRYHTEDPWSAVEMTRAGGHLSGLLPGQPAAGKLEYQIKLVTVDRQIMFLPSKVETVVIRFKDWVPLWILVPHIVMMFFSVLIGMRAGLGAIFAPAGMRFWAWIALGGMTVGGMVLGPIVQKYAFGDYWTGWPFGGDWTDNKMLVMWLSWMLAAALIGKRPARLETRNRVVVVFAALVMTAAYLIPHSMGGSELDYDAVDRGIDPSEAVETGRR